MLAEIHITVLDIIVYALAGLVIGMLARLLVPGRQDMSIGMTILIGIVAAVLGGLAWEALFPSNDGIAWIGSIIVGVVLVYLYTAYVGRGRGRPVTR
jgi:uncharacterized membrane protein YeaQ/YmgE (transglycosylase-associated protein family)